MLIIVMRFFSLHNNYCNIYIHSTDLCRCCSLPNSSLFLNTLVALHRPPLRIYMIACAHLPYCSACSTILPSSYVVLLFPWLMYLADIFLFF